jgi:cysteinyl-tRNA synthetase
MLQTHYRSPLDFSPERLDEAATAYERFVTMARTIRWHRGRPAAGAGAREAERSALLAAVAEARAGFEQAMEDDFNSAGALGALFDLARAANGFLSVNGSVLDAADLDVLAAAEGAVVELLNVLGVTLPADEAAAALPDGILPLARELADYAGDDPSAAVEAILSARAEARAAKDWARADAVRDGLAALGVRVEDTATGARISVSEI